MMIPQTYCRCLHIKYGYRRKKRNKPRKEHFCIYESWHDSIFFSTFIVRAPILLTHSVFAEGDLFTLHLKSFVVALVAVRSYRQQEEDFRK